MKLLGSTGNLIDKRKDGEIIPTLEVSEVFVQCNLVDEQYQ